MNTKQCKFNLEASYVEISQLDVQGTGSLGRLPLQYSIRPSSSKHNTAAIDVALYIRSVSYGDSSLSTFVASVSLEGQVSYVSCSTSPPIQLGPQRVALVDLAIGAEYIVTLPSKHHFDVHFSQVAQAKYSKPEFYLQTIIMDLGLMELPRLPPHPSTLIRTLGEPNISIHASKAILAHASPFFQSMLLGNWKESSAQTPISVQCTARSLLVCLIHIYSGWLPGHSPPSAGNVQEPCSKHQCNLGKFVLDDWHDVLDTSRMLGLATLARAANEEMCRVLQADRVELDKDVAKHPMWVADSQGSVPVEDGEEESTKE